MPAYRLKIPGGTNSQAEHISRAVLNVLQGTPLDTAATSAGLQTSDLSAALEVFCQAGRHALERQAVPDWWQVHLQFTDWSIAEATAATHLAPLMKNLQATGDLTAWWFIRKFPCWRARLRVPDDGARQRVRAALDALVSDGALGKWWTSVYEPEITAFGGTAAMAAAHDLFTADSRNILDLLAHNTTTLGRRELSILLCTRMLRSAGLEWYEQADVWHRVSAERPLAEEVSVDHLNRLAADLKQFLLADTDPNGLLFGAEGPATFVAPWASSFANAGQCLGTVARSGTLDRGLREVLSYHVIFHWNRLGLPSRTQGILARAATCAILGTRER